MTGEPNVNFYEFDGCYSKPDSSRFDLSLNSRFYKSVVESVAQCQAEAMRKNADFFLMNDISSSTITDNNSNCYVPKPVSSNLGSFVSVDSMLQLFSDLFGSAAKISVSDTCNNMLFRRTPTSPLTSQKCFTYTLDEQVYAPKMLFAHYKKPILNESNLGLATSIQSRPTSYYANPTLLAELASYKELLYINETNIQESGPLYSTFKNFICTPSQEKERLFDIQLANLQAKYDNLIGKIDDISVDLSNINYLKMGDNNSISALNARIASKKQELANLLGSGGANNGRLGDNVFLTQFKIIENGILLLIMVVVCFIYYKTRNLKTITNASTTPNSLPNTNNPLNSVLASATNVVNNAIKK
jgi:hypothetical protein|uniref:Uncharacterized protein n=1 Tax=viral metagenome TaxID=1070528 RepID=A0A6C0CB00_9ZZZZ